MASRNPYFRFYPSDFMGGVRGMTAQEVGLYTMLLCRMYEEDGPIERDDFKLATYCGMRQATFTATLEKLIRLSKITVRDGRLFNDRAEAEISNRAHDLEIAIRAGKASAEKRQQNQRQKAAPVQRSFNHTDTDTDTKKRDTNVSLALFAPEGVKPNMFEEFWQAFPRKVGKDKAAPAYAKAMKKVSHDDLMFALSQQIPTMRTQETKFIPHPATWLNQGRWKDEIEQSHSNSGRGPGGTSGGMVAAFAAVAARRSAGPKRD